MAKQKCMKLLATILHKNMTHIEEEEQREKQTKIACYQIIFENHNIFLWNIILSL